VVGELRICTTRPVKVGSLIIGGGCPIVVIPHHAIHQLPICGTAGIRHPPRFVRRQHGHPAESEPAGLPGRVAIADHVGGGSGRPQADPETGQVLVGDVDLPVLVGCETVDDPLGDPWHRPPQIRRGIAVARQADPIGAH